MNKRILSVLLLSVSFPLAAVAQTADPNTGTASPDATQVQPMDGQNDAKGGMNDARPLEQRADNEGASPGPFVTVPETGAWRVSDLEGKSVYGADGESIGSISDILVSQDGSVNAVIIGVGGFLGMGQKDVAVDMSALELGPGATQEQADAASQTDPGVSNETTASTQADPIQPQAPETGGTAAGQGTAMGTGMPAANQQMAANDVNGVRIGDDGLPDRIILNVTREQLEDAPEFEGVRANQER